MLLLEKSEARTVRLYAWSGMVLFVGTLVTFIPLMHFIPPPAPSNSPEQVRDMFIENKLAIQIACLIMILCWTLWATFGMSLWVAVRRMERGIPILSTTMLALVAGTYTLFILSPTVWALVSYRVDTLDPGVIQIMNDFVWYLFMFVWPPFGLICLVLAAAILKDHNVPTVYPRWLGYLNIWAAILFSPAGLIVFWKEGPFAYNGIFAFWIPALVFFAIWLPLMVVMTLRAVTTSGENDREAVQVTERSAL